MWGCLWLPSASLFVRLGRLPTFALGAAAGMGGGALGLAAFKWELPPSALFVACALIGLAQGMGQFYRFAALEVVRPSRKPLAVTLVLSGGVIAAFAGPQLAIATHEVDPHAKAE